MSGIEPQSNHFWSPGVSLIYHCNLQPEDAIWKASMRIYSEKDTGVVKTRGSLETSHYHTDPATVVRQILADAQTLKIDFTRSLVGKVWLTYEREGLLDLPDWRQFMRDLAAELNMYPAYCEESEDQQ